MDALGVMALGEHQFLWLVLPVLETLGHDRQVIVVKARQYLEATQRPQLFAGLALVARLGGEGREHS